MIGFDFDYYRPENIHEALCIYNELSDLGKKPVYYGGGTELISMARAGDIIFDAVIDLKYIAECNYHGFVENEYCIGSSVTLTQIAEANKFELLSKTVKRIADHTIQGKITLAGNLAGSIIYREAALPLMLVKCFVSVMSDNGIKKLPFLQIFDGELKINPNEFIVQIFIEQSYLSLPYVHVKKTKNEKIDYPIITFAAISKNREIYAAACGIFEKPMLIPSQYINDNYLNTDDAINKTIDLLYNYIQTDFSASKEYRVFVLKNILKQTMGDIKGAKC